MVLQKWRCPGWWSTRCQRFPPGSILGCKIRANTETPHKPISGQTPKEVHGSSVQANSPRLDAGYGSKPWTEEMFGWLHCRIKYGGAAVQAGTWPGAHSHLHLGLAASLLQPSQPCWGPALPCCQLAVPLAGHQARHSGRQGLVGPHVALPSPGGFEHSPSAASASKSLPDLRQVT